MLTLLLALLPLALAAAVSPVMLTEQAVILSTPGGRRAARAYAAGVAVVVALVVGAVVALGQSFSLPKAPTLNASLDLLLGAALVGLADLLRRRSRHDRPPRKQRDLSTAQAAGFGAFSMTTNVTSLVLVVPAAREIASSDRGALGIVVATVFLVLVVSLPAWVPVALTDAAPRQAGRFLGRLRELIDRHGRTAVVVLVAGAGVFLLVRGVVRLLG